jgi:hypothetical protein
VLLSYLDCPGFISSHDSSTLYPLDYHTLGVKDLREEHDVIEKNSSDYPGFNRHPGA